MRKDARTERGQGCMQDGRTEGKKEGGKELWSLLLSSWEVEESSAIPGCEWERYDYDPWPASSSRKEGRGPWSLPFSSCEVEESGHGHPPSLF